MSAPFPTNTQSTPAQSEAEASLKEPHLPEPAPLPLLIERSEPGRRATLLPSADVPEKPLETLIDPALLRSTPPNLPEISEPQLVRHYMALSHRNASIDELFYPLGSCTMKYNPKVNEWAAGLPGFSGLHPLTPPELAQGALELLYRLEKMLCEIGGMARATLQPAAGAHGELTGLLIIRAYHHSHSDTARSKIIIPDSAHGTNPATVRMVGYEALTVKSDQRGGVDLDHLKSLLDPTVAGLMLTNPNTLGVFDENILEISRAVHDCGGLLYYDGANLNAIAGKCRPVDMGFDIVHFNLHKTFSTPHGGGGPGAGPVGVVQKLCPFLPRPLIEKGSKGYFLDFGDEEGTSIGRLMTFWGNFGILLRAYTYICSLGADGLTTMSESAVLSANYVMSSLSQTLDLPYARSCKHECVFSAKTLKRETGVRTLDLAKRLIDYGFHPPTIYFPLIVEEALMIEPTESETKATLDHFVQALQSVVAEAYSDPRLVKEAPYSTPVGRLDETGAARNPNLRW